MSSVPKTLHKVGERGTGNGERRVDLRKDSPTAQFVKDDFVLVFIDTPGNKDVLSAHAKAANKELVKKYKVSGFPTARWMRRTSS